MEMELHGLWQIERPSFETCGERAPSFQRHVILCDPLLFLGKIFVFSLPFYRLRLEIMQWLKPEPETIGKTAERSERHSISREGANTIGKMVLLSHSTFEALSPILAASDTV